MKTFKLSFFLTLILILSCSTQKKLIKSSATIIDRKIMNSLYQDGPVFSSYENVKLFIDSLDISSHEIAYGADQVSSIICQLLIDENAKIKDIYFHQSAGATLDSTVTQILNSSKFKRYRSDDSNRIQKLYTQISR